MKTSILIFTCLFLTSTAQAKDVQLFNPEIFGQPTSNAIKLLIDKKPDEIEPYMVTTDIKCGKYHAASVFYRGKVSFDEIRGSINKIYKDNENVKLLKQSTFAIWRVTDKRFAIQLCQEDEDVYRVIYLEFLQSKEAFESMMKAMGADAKAIDALHEDDCKDTSNSSKSN
jgi:hypothetical protein